jgi:hypothetical protein
MPAARSRITPADIRILAFTLVDRHGAKALGLADHVVYELEGAGEEKDVDAWRALRSEIEDALTGRITREGPVQVH